MRLTAIVSTTEGPPGWAGVSPGTGSSTGMGNTQRRAMVRFSTANRPWALTTRHRGRNHVGRRYNNTPLTIPITLTITAPGTIGTDKASLRSYRRGGLAPANQTMHIWNCRHPRRRWPIPSARTRPG